MRQLSIILGLILVSHFTIGQNSPRSIEGKGFKSVFQKLVTGEFNGTVNGLLILKNVNKEETILDFHCNDSKLVIEVDSSAVYDVSTKIYKGKMTGGKIEIEYKTYAAANAFSIKFNDDWYGFSYIDGSCEGNINGLDYEYKIDKSKEYLILHFNSEITLSNYTYLVRAEPNMNPDKVKNLKQREKKVQVLPNSTLIFAIKRL